MPQPWIRTDQLEFPQDPMAEYAVLTASFILWGLSGRKYHGVRRTTQTYVCSQDDLPVNCGFDPVLGAWRAPGSDVAILVAPNAVGPGQGRQFRLRNQPVRKIHSLTIAGEAAPSASYSVSNYRILRIDGDAEMSACSGATVDYSYGVGPPAAGEAAAIELANELILSWNDSEACSLPERTKSVSRQGLSFDMIDPMDFVDKGRTGLLKVDWFLKTANPSGANAPARVFSPDIPRGAKRT